MNFLVAWLLFSVGFMTGLPTSVDQVPKGAVLIDQALTITSVSAKSPAQIAGLKIGDRLVSLSTSIDSTDTPSSDSVRYFIKNHGNESIKVNFLRGPDKLSTNVTPESKVAGAPLIGISMDVIGKLKLPIHVAVWEGLRLTWSQMVSTISGFYHLIYDGLTGHGNISALSGPVGIVGIVGDAAKFGFVYLLSFTALISINLAVLNLIPFPALDGGQLLFLLIEKIKGSEIKPKIANIINTIGFGLLILLMIIITYHDIMKLF